jgi:hypothetical protein
MAMLEFLQQRSVSCYRMYRESHFQLVEMNEMAVPLRKHSTTGERYSRRQPIEEKIDEILRLSRDERARRAAITSKAHPDYIPSECLLHLVRETKSDNSDGFFEKLFKILIARVERAAGTTGGRHRVNEREAETSTSTKVREAVVFRFVELLTLDRQHYEDRVDYAEVNFNSYIASLRATAKEKALADENRHSALTYTDEAEPSPEVEKAAGSYDIIEPEKLDDKAYRLRLLRAIVKLPEDERLVIAMLLKQYPIESEDPNVTTICKVIGCVEKTVRNRRDRAFIKLRKALSEGQVDE